jgi:hypothetical protein
VNRSDDRRDGEGRCAGLGEQCPLLSVPVPPLPRVFP